MKLQTKVDKVTNYVVTQELGSEDHCFIIIGVSRDGKHTISTPLDDAQLENIFRELALQINVPHTKGHKLELIDGEEKT